MSEITVFVPGLFAATLGATERGLDRTRWPHLWALCARAKLESLPNLSPEEQLCTLFGTKGDSTARLAPAALTASLDLAPERAQSSGLTRADPVHLRADPNQVLLFNSAEIMPSATQADDLLAELNRGFENLEFYRGDHPARWYCNTSVQPQTHSTNIANGRSVAPFLPAGDGAAEFHRNMNDAQMLLHDCAVNREREAEGLPAINSVWLWGGQISLPALDPAVDLAVGDDVLLAAIAAQTAVAWSSDRTCSEILATQKPGSHALVVVGSPNGATRRECEAFSLDAFEREWAAPLSDALRHFKLTSLRVVSDRESYAIRPWDLFKLWRKSAPRVA